MELLVVFLFCVAAPQGQSVAESIDGSLVEVEAKTKRFVEGEEAEFECRYREKTPTANLSWYLQDSHVRHPTEGYRIPVFETPTGGPRPVSKGPFRFRLKMRRDFETNWLICKSSDGGRANLTFGRVKKTIPFDVSQPNHIFLVPPKGIQRKMRLCCNVSRAIEDIKMELLVFNHYEKINLTQKYANGTYACHAKYDLDHDFWGLSSCVVRSKIGTVYSQVKNMLFFNPIFEVPRPPISRFLDEKVTVTVRYADKQPPPSWMNAFKIYEINDRNEIVREVKVLHVNLSEPLDYFKITFVKYMNLSAKITFAPERTGRFQLFFQVLEHYRPYNRTGPILHVRKNYAKISEEALLHSTVTLGAFANLSFHLNTSLEPLKEHLSVEGPPGSELPRSDFLFAFDRATSQARLDFVVNAEGDYRVIVRLPKLNTNGKKHKIRSSRPKLLSPVKPIDLLLADKIVVPVVYSGRQPPAFPLRAFKFSEISSDGKILRANQSVSSVKITPSVKAQFTANVTFAPGGAGYFQISLHVGSQRLNGPRIILRKSVEPKSDEPKSDEPSDEKPFSTGIIAVGVVATVILVISIVASVIYERRKKTPADRSPNERMLDDAAA